MMMVYLTYTAQHNIVINFFLNDIKPKTFFST